MAVTLHMECSICYSEITSATGKVELSCSHPFHFSCLTQWFNKQKCQGSHENCPLCRHESNDFEKMPLASEDDEDDEDEDDEDDEDDEHDWDQVPSLDQLIAQQRTRERFQLLKTTMTPQELQLYAASRIKACWRGYQDRLLYYDRLYNKEVIQRHHEYISNCQRSLKADLNRARFIQATLGLSRHEVKLMAVRKIQAIWRSSKSRPAVKSIVKCGVWQEVSPGVWERPIMNPEDDAPIVFVGSSPPS